jgi:hypothetical protein
MIPMMDADVLLKQGIDAFERGDYEAAVASYRQTALFSRRIEGTCVPALQTGQSKDKFLSNKRVAMFQHILGQYCVGKACLTLCQIWRSHLTQ